MPRSQERREGKEKDTKNRKKRDNVTIRHH
jgi:hypothetical protein